MTSTFNWRDKYKSWFAPLALIIVGIATRFYVIAHAGSWWFDESVSQTFAKIPFGQSWQYLKYENSPPLYYWLLRLWGLLFGFQEISLRLLSVLLGILTLLAIIRLSQELFGKTVGLWAGAMYAVASLAIFLDTEARMYSLLGLLTALSYFYFLKILFKKPARWEIALFILVTTLALYTNITGLWIPLTQLIVLAFIKPKEISRFKLTSWIALPVLLFSPWLIAFAIEAISFSRQIPAGNWWYFGNAIPFFTFFLGPSYFFNFWSGTNVWVACISFMASIIIIGWFLYHSWKRRKLFGEKLTVVALGLMVPLLFSLIIVLTNPRYFYQSAIFFWIILAYLIEKIFQKIELKIIFGVFVVVVGCYAVFNLLFGIKGSFHGNWDGAVKWIDAQHADLVLAMPKLWAAETYDPSTPFYFLPPPIIFSESVTPLEPFQAVLRYNYNWGSATYQLNSSQKNILYVEIKTITGSSSKIIFGYENTATEQVILSDLQTLGFQREADFRVTGYDSETIAVFDRPAD